MSKWITDKTTLPADGVERIWYHNGDSAALMSSRLAGETWRTWFGIMRPYIVGWQPVIPPEAPKPPTQQELDRAECVKRYQAQGIDYANCDPTFDFLVGWNAALDYARSSK